MIYIFSDLHINILDSTKLMQYLVLVESVITYGIVGWGGAFNNIVAELQDSQNQILT